MRHWSKAFGAERLSVAVVCDADPRELAAALASSFGALSGSGFRPDLVGEPGPRPWFKALPLPSLPGEALLRGEYGAPAADSPDFPALSVACAMLDDLMLERVGGLARGVRARLYASAPPSVGLLVYNTQRPAAAKAAVDSALADLAAGLCVDLTAASGAIGPVGRSLEAYKARAITAVYTREASVEAMAARIASDLAAGGDGTALFRMASQIRAVSSMDLVRVANRYLLEAPSAWVALGDPTLVAGLRTEDFAKTR
jgi:predicted Zn-dependent peptidase